ncbi:MAG: hypothetical protein OEV78_12905 [Spirochaetia bacterium]|nr:hypothetical protein [Spirochaetia bacterium]
MVAKLKSKKGAGIYRTRSSDILSSAEAKRQREFMKEYPPMPGDWYGSVSTPCPTDPA